MSGIFQPYSDDTNLTMICAISLAVIHDVEPDEELSIKKLVDRIAQIYEEGDLIIAGADSTTAGGFGNVDLLTLIIIPVVIAVLSELGKQLLSVGVNELKKKIKEEEENKNKAVKVIDVVVELEYKLVNKKMKSKKVHSKEKVIKQALKAHIKKQLGMDKS